MSHLHRIHQNIFFSKFHEEKLQIAVGLKPLTIFSCIPFDHFSNSINILYFKFVYNIGGVYLNQLNQFEKK